MSDSDLPRQAMLRTTTRRFAEAWNEEVEAEEQELRLAARAAERQRKFTTWFYWVLTGTAALILMPLLLLQCSRGP